MTKAYYHPDFIPPPFTLRRGRLAVTYRSRWRTLLTTVLLVGVALTVGALTGLLLAASIVSAVIVVYRAVSTVQLLRGVPLPGPSGGAGPPLEGGVREPRGPRPMSPAGAAALPLPPAADSTGAPPDRVRHGFTGTSPTEPRIS